MAVNIMLPMTLDFVMLCVSDALQEINSEEKIQMINGRLKLLVII